MKKLATGKPTVVLDFDGTLAEIASDPGDARLLQQDKRELSLLAKSVEVVILTGRPAGFVRKSIKGVSGIRIAGLHGNSRLRKTKKILGLEAAAHERFAGVKGVCIERKPSGFAIHYRKARSNALAARKLVEEFAVKAQGVLVLHGRKAVEFLPAGALTKADALEKIVRENAGRKIFFVGDDASDLQAITRCRRYGRFNGAVVASRETPFAKAGKTKKIKRRMLFSFLRDAVKKAGWRVVEQA